MESMGQTEFPLKATRKNISANDKHHFPDTGLNVDKSHSCYPDVVDVVMVCVGSWTEICLDTLSKFTIDKIFSIRHCLFILNPFSKRKCKRNDPGLCKATVTPFEQLCGKNRTG